jgi:hypothetical protein
MNQLPTKALAGELNIYQPHLMEIIRVIPETGDTKTFHIQFLDSALRETFSFLSGQFAEYSVFGEGEATFCISSSPTRRDHLEFSVKRVGRVTEALHQLNQGDIIGLRGPYGNHFPLDQQHYLNQLYQQLLLLRLHLLYNLLQGLGIQLVLHLLLHYLLLVLQFLQFPLLLPLLLILLL